VDASRKPSDVARPDGDASTKAIVPLPQWCIDNAFDGIYANRTNGCEITGINYTTTRTTNGVVTVTGQAQLNVYILAYTSTTLSTWGHQIQVSAYSGWGDALAASVQGLATRDGACTTNSSSFPSQPISPLNSFRNGEAYFATTATALGAVGSCRTTWGLTFTNGAYTPASINYDMIDIRCDNNTGGNPNVGCVVPWFASALTYSQSSYPSLARHVSLALGSGLPGGSFEAPLTRTTNQAVIDLNRDRACGDAPSIAGLTCDEYPIATSYQGLSAGGTRRTFNNCAFNLPQRTGPLGASACMITGTDNNAQGGVNTQFFRRERVLDGDPFRVYVVA
jgi:hypothetical protein